ncbi:CD209 antigen-like protein E [Silurus meridionalis]|uniref:CD209 antigen-like protein E n=1 Tax=Silurus meridionalis TaxID=175797 RepID=UPI001EEB3635|nr:CD209 antigen-like protein E [Silurus meridionalis]
MAVEMEKKHHYSKETRSEDGDYMNWSPKHKTVSSFSDCEINIISALGLLLMLGVLLALCVIGILYHNKRFSFEILSKQYENATATVMMQELTVKKMETLYEALKVKHQQVQEDLLACKATQNRGPCEKGWKYFGLNCYYFSTSKLNWTRSRDECVEKGGHLVIITSNAEQVYVYSQIQETHWIGLNDLETEGKWMWVNNQPLQETGVMFWFSAPEGPNEPDNWKMVDPSGENCGALGNVASTNYWFDASCSELKKFICEKGNNPNSF